jgi:anti-sigma regulatory factor (Ser/Thr protein kinase)
MMSTETTINKAYAAIPSSVAAARNELADFAVAAGISRERLDGVRLAVSEALSNVVLHAYRGEPGEIRLTASVAGGELWILIADEGVGLLPRIDGPGLGLGLVLIAHETDELTIAKGATGGTELRMRFNLQAAQAGAEVQSRGFVARATSAAAAPF